MINLETCSDCGDKFEPHMMTFVRHDPDTKVCLNCRDARDEEDAEE